MDFFKASLTAQNALDLATQFLDLLESETTNDIQTNDIHIAELCAQAESALSRIKRADRRVRVRSMDQHDIAVCKNIVDNYEKQAELWENRLKNTKMSKRIRKKQTKWKNPNLKEASSVDKPNSSCGATENLSCETVGQSPPASNFPHFSRKEVRNPDLPKLDALLIDTPQLVYSLRVLQIKESSELKRKLFSDGFETSMEGQWARDISSHEQEHLRSLATQIAREFINDKLGEDGTIAEVTCLAPILGREHYRILVGAYIGKITSNPLLDLPLVQGLPRLIQSAASEDYLQADDLVRILKALSECLQKTHKQTPSFQYLLVMAISRVLDAMTHTHVKGLDQDDVHRPLSELLEGLRNSTDAYLVYQAAYALQALKNVPDDESPWKKLLRQGGEVVGAAVGLGISAYTMDIPGFLEKLETLQVSAEQIVEVAFLAYETASALIEGGHGLRDSFRTVVSYQGKQPWYQELRLADVLIQNGDLALFEQRVLNSVYRADPSFQWGLCQRLGEIAANPLLCYEARERALNFLGEIFSDDFIWREHLHIKQLTIAILLQLKQQPLDNGALAAGSSSSNLDNVTREGRDTHQPSAPHVIDDEQRVQEKAELLIEELGRKSKREKNILYRQCVSNPPYPYSLKPNEPSHKLMSLLQRVQNVPDIKKDLEVLKKRRLAESKTIDLYIEPSAKASLLVPDDPEKSLMDSVVEFLEQGGRVLLLLGDSGAGKSTFNQALEQKLWERYEDNGWIPLHINLPAIDRPHQDLIAKHLLRNDFTESQIREMKKSSKFTLICDGYDESRQTKNLYETNELTIDPNITTQWTAKMVISCRSEYLGSKYQDRFQPSPRKSSDASLTASQDANTAADFKEVEIAPFTTGDIKKYVEKYVGKVSFVSFDAAEWRTKEYMEALETVPNLMDLVKNPFLLTLSLEVLPRVVDVHHMQELSRTSITRVRLYDHFLEHWLEREKKRVRGKELSQQDQAAYDTLVFEGFAQNGINFLKRLAAAIYKEQSGQPVIEYLRFRDEKTWKAAFFKREDEMRILREACPLVRSGNQYRFIHRSLLEYCFALAVFDPQERNALRPDLSKTLQRRSSEVSISSCEEDSMAEKELTDIQQTNVRDHPLSWKNLVLEPSILHFLVERVQQESLFKKQLLKLIELSKNFPKAHRAAANAITILVRSGHQFNGADLREIKIRGADLSGGEFDSAQLQKADLTRVNLRNIWLRNADLSEANMKDATFGESPYLVQRSAVQCCVYSPDGKVCALGLCSNEIKLHDTTTWKEMHTLQGHDDMVAIVVYSPDGKQIASGSDDRTVRLWDPLEGSDITVFHGHTGRVECVVYSPKGDLLASSSSDKTVRLWNGKILKQGPILWGHDSIVMSVVFSPSGEHVASGSYDNTVRIWSAQDGSPIRTLSQHTSCVKSVVYSPDGKHIASASYDRTVRIWDSTNGNSIQTLSHMAKVTSVAYSPNGLQIAAGSGNQVQLWDPKMGKKLHLLSGHTDEITSVVYSPTGHQIASSGHDKTVRLWDTQSGAPGPTLNGHVNNIMSIVYAPNGHQIATASLDKTVRLWDSQTGVSVETSSGHTDRVNSVTYSPKGCTLASGGFDKTLRLWNAKTGVPIKTFGDHANQTTTSNVSQTTEFKVGRIERAVYSPSGGHIVLGSADMCVYIWNMETGKVVHELVGHDDCVTSVVYSPNGKEVASGSDDWTVYLWDAELGTVRHRLVEHSAGVTDVAYSPNGKQIASGSFDKTVILWHADSGEFIKKLVGHTGMVTSVVYSPDGMWIASGSNDRTVRVWDVFTENVIELKGHTDRVRSVVFSPSSEEIATASLDYSVKLWKVGSGQLLTTIKVFQSPIRSIAWVENDLDNNGHDKTCHDKDCHGKNGLYKDDIESFLAAGSDDKSVRVWSVRRTESVPQVQLRWSSTHDRLVVSGAKFGKTLGLTDINMKLMEQRGAKGTSSGVVEQQQKITQAMKLRAASEKVVAMHTTVAQMKPGSRRKPDASSSGNDSLPSPPQEPMELSQLPQHMAREP
ncbi:hypothetical protein BGZ67_005688 [Mortierella alpina]|nr:hypothetical protein BGZ67_005688 [Mortierella alpina]